MLCGFITLIMVQRCSALSSALMRVDSAGNLPVINKEGWKIATSGSLHHQRKALSLSLSITLYLSPWLSHFQYDIALLISNAQSFKYEGWIYILIYINYICWIIWMHWMQYMWKYEIAQNIYIYIYLVNLLFIGWTDTLPVQKKVAHSNISLDRRLLWLRSEFAVEFVVNVTTFISNPELH